MPRCVILLILLFLWAPLKAQDWDIWGYGKYLGSRITGYLPQEDALVDHQLHLRLNSRWYLSPRGTLAMEWRLRAFYGDLPGKLPGFKSFVVSSYPLTDMAWTLADEGSLFAYAQMDRFFWDYAADDWQVTIGRQRVAWGTTLVWNVSDLYNPQSILDFDYEERPGSDVLRFQYFTGPASRWEVVMQPAGKKRQRSLSLMGAFNRWNYDFYLIMAWQREKPVLAGAFSGDIAGAGFRGEFKASGHPRPVDLEETYLPGFVNLSDGRGADVQMTLSLDYTFANSLYLHGEILYNSIGVSKNTALLAFQAQKAGLLSAARYSLFAETAYQWHPLVRLDLFTIFNPDDRSYILAPSVSWSAATNLDVYLIGLLGQGNRLSEFGAMGRASYLRLKYSF